MNLSFSSRQANTEKPKWNEEELETRTGVMSLVKLEDCHIAKIAVLLFLPSCTSFVVARWKRRVGSQMLGWKSRSQWTWVPQLLEVLSPIDSVLTIWHTFNSPPPHILGIDLLLMPFLALGQIQVQDSKTWQTHYDQLFWPKTHQFSQLIKASVKWSSHIWEAKVINSCFAFCGDNFFVALNHSSILKFCQLRLLHHHHHLFTQNAVVT